MSKLRELNWYATGYPLQDHELVDYLYLRREQIADLLDAAAELRDAERAYEETKNRLTYSGANLRRLQAVRRMIDVRDMIGGD